MHFIISPVGSAGDVHPMLGLALELRGRGHEISFITSGYFRELVERHQLEFVELGTKEQYLESARHPDLWNPKRAFQHIFRQGLQPSMRPHFEMHRERYVPGRTVAISSCLGFGARVAQEALQMPLITIHLQPAVIWSDIQPPALHGVIGPRWMKSLMYWIGETFVIDWTVRADLNAFRSEFNLPPMRHTTRWWHSPDLVLCMFPEWFGPKQADWPANVVQTGFPLWDEAGDAPLPAEVETFLQAGEAPIVFTPGSANLFGQSFFEAAIGACETLGRRGILCTRFSEQIPASLPNGVRYFPYVPFRPLLPRAAALVHHGGVGTTAQALAAGIPQLVMPLAHDQFDNVARLKRLGVGDALPAAHFQAPAVAQSLAKLLSSDEVNRSCQSVANRFTGADGLPKAADAVEAFAKDVERRAG